MEQTEEKKENTILKTGRKLLTHLPLIKKRGIIPIQKKKIIAEKETLEPLIKEIQALKKPTLAKIIETIRDYQEEVGQLGELIPPTEPLLFLLQDNREIQIYEGVRPGIQSITRSDGRDAEIELSEQKLHSLLWPGDEIKVWVAHERNAYALPYEPIVDSNLSAESYEQILANNKSRTEQDKLKGAHKILKLALIGIFGLIAIVIIAQVVFGINLIEMLRGPAQTATPAGKEAIDIVVNT